MSSLKRTLLGAGVWMIVALEVPTPAVAGPPAVAERASRGPGEDFIRRYGTSAFRVSAEHLEYSPDGRSLAAAETYQTVRVLDAKTGQTKFTCQLEYTPVTGVGFSPDGEELVIVERDGITVWDARDGKKVKPLGQTTDNFRYLREFTRSPDRQWWAIANPSTIFITKWNSGKPLHEIAFKSDSPSLAIGSSGQWVAAANARSPEIHVWKAPKFDAALQWKPSETPVQALAASPDGKTVYAVCQDGSAHAWNIDKDLKQSPIFQVKPNSAVSLLASPDEKHIAVGTYSHIALYEIATGQAVHVLETIHSQNSASLAFSPDGTTLAIGSRSLRPIELWDVKTGKRLHEQIPPIERVFATKDPQRFGSVHQGVVDLWNRTTGRIDESFSLYYPSSSRFSKGQAICDGSEQIAISTERKVYYRDLADEKSFVELGHLPLVYPTPRTYSAQYHTATLLGLGTIQLGKYTFSRNEPEPTLERIVKGPAARFVEFGFSTDGKTLAAAFEDQSVFLWDAETGQERQRLKLEKPPTRVLLNSDASWLAVLHADSIDVWDLKLGSRRHQLPEEKAAHRVMAFGSKEGQLATASANEAIRIWNLETGKEILALDPPGSIESLAFSPDDGQLAAGLTDKSIRVYDLETRKEIHKLEGHLGPVTQVLFHPEGKRLASASKARELIYWDLSTQKQVSARKLFDEIDDLFWAADGNTLMVEERRGRLNYIRDAEKLVAGMARHRMDTLSFGHGFAFAKNTRSLAVIDGWGIRLLDGTTRGEVGFLPFDKKPLFKQAEWAPDGRVLMVAAVDVFGWDIAKQKEIYRVTGPQMKGSPTAMCKAPDGRTVATALSSQKVCFWEPQTGELIREVSLDRKIEMRGWAFISSVRFSADGRLLFAMAPDMYFVIEVESGLVWFQKPNQIPADTSFELLEDHRLLSAEAQGTARLWSWKPDNTHRQELDPESLWRSLAGNDGPTVYRSMFALADLADRAVEFLAVRLPELRKPGTGPEKIASWISDLGDPSPLARRTASEELRALGEQAHPQLRKSLENENVPEPVRSRIQILLAAQNRDADPELLAVRGVQVLEWIASPKARELLTQLAKNHSDRLGTEAKAALDRLSVPKP